MQSLAALDKFGKELSQIISSMLNSKKILLDNEKLIQLKRFLVEISEQAEVLRDETMANIANGELTVRVGNKHLEAIRWLRRVSIHVNKIMMYLGRIV